MTTPGNGGIIGLEAMKGVFIMNEALKTFTTRTSVKAYKPEMPPQELIDDIITAGTYAPTGMNRQSPIIIEVTDKAVRDKLSGLNAAVMGANIDPFYGAPVVLVVLADKSVGTYLYDGSLVMGNLLNAAHAAGLGACWIHRAKEVFQTPEGKEILTKLGITGDYEGIGNCIIGYPANEPPAPKPRKENWVYRV